jgi:hypothetical protein
MVTVARVIAVVDVAIEAVTTVEPWAGTNEDSTVEPIRAIVAVRGAIVGFVVEVPVRAPWLRSNGDADCHLGWAKR